MRCIYLFLTFLLLLSIPLLLNPPEGSACGPFLPAAQFGYIHNPGPEFLRGELGIVKPQYIRRNLIVAYRYLSSVPLSAAEIKALSPAPPQQPPPPGSFPLRGQDAVARWQEQRSVVPGAPKIVGIEAYRFIFINGLYAGYQNCLDDAFVSAASTLYDRVARWGLQNANVSEWLKGQDLVFANCDGSAPVPGILLTPAQAAANQPHIPAELPAAADPLLRADRHYQIAAALFYAGRYAEAAGHFGEIAADVQSPWRDSGRYLAARALIRKGTVDDDKAALESAEKALQDILADPRQKRWHESARGLLDFVSWHLHAEDRMVELGAALSKPGLGAKIETAIDDYTTIWARLHKGPAARSQLADWITTFQSGNEQRAIERWRAGGGEPWLVAALAGAAPGAAVTPELIAAASKKQPADPGYATAAYHAIRLLIALHREDEARRWADRALSDKLPLDAENAFRTERLTLARDWPEFLRFAPRRPVAVDIPFADDADQNLSGYKNQIKPFAFDIDATDALNREVPLDLWVDASHDPLLPRNLQGDVAQAGWVRAVLLNRTVDARTLARRVVELRPELAEGMRSYDTASSPGAARFAAVFLMLRTPGLAPTVRDGMGRLTKVTHLDEFRDNWWRLRTPAGLNPFPLPPPREPGAPVPARFLTGAQRAQGEKEWNELLAAAVTGPNYLCTETLSWTHQNPGDPRVPEALHLAVRATHYGLTDAGTAAYSRKAFERLHSRYPNTTWAKETRYWY
jgi:tetratricopeptide (TPR) repeat protein